MQTDWDQGPKEALLEKVVSQIKKDVEAGYMTAIEELLGCVPGEDLKAFLSEVEED